MLGELIPCGGGDSILLLKPKLLIGRRSSSCDIILEYPNVSSHHCELQLINGYWQIRDLQSRNGVKVNGERVDSKFLAPGDEIAIAKHRFEIRYNPLSEGPPPEEEDAFAMSLLEKAGLQKRQEELRRLRLPPSARRQTPPTKTDASEDAAMEWLSGD